ncbi:MAG: hypothetical protein HY696_00410 [Deltaproteobacteria bacterium]|nr:hypothetical protein [Deltaproteobacteria bacterium]
MRRAAATEESPAQVITADPRITAYTQSLSDPAIPRRSLGRLLHRVQFFPERPVRLIFLLDHIADTDRTLLLAWTEQFIHEVTTLTGNPPAIGIVTRGDAAAAPHFQLPLTRMDAAGRAALFGALRTAAAATALDHAAAARLALAALAPIDTPDTDPQLSNDTVFVVDGNLYDGRPSFLATRTMVEQEGVTLWYEDQAADRFARIGLVGADVTGDALRRDARDQITPWPETIERLRQSAANFVAQRGSNGAADLLATAAATTDFMYRLAVARALYPDRPLVALCRELQPHIEIMDPLLADLRCAVATSPQSRCETFVGSALIFLDILRDLQTPEAQTAYVEEGLPLFLTLPDNLWASNTVQIGTNDPQRIVSSLLDYGAVSLDRLIPALIHPMNAKPFLTRSDSREDFSYSYAIRDYHLLDRFANATPEQIETITRAVRDNFSDPLAGVIWCALFRDLPGFDRAAPLDDVALQALVTAEGVPVLRGEDFRKAMYLMSDYQLFSEAMRLEFAKRLLPKIWPHTVPWGHFVSSLSIETQTTFVQWIIATHADSVGLAEWLNVLLDPIPLGRRATLLHDATAGKTFGAEATAILTTHRYLAEERLGGLLAYATSLRDAVESTKPTIRQIPERPDATPGVMLATDYALNHLRVAVRTASDAARRDLLQTIIIILGSTAYSWAQHDALVVLNETHWYPTELTLLADTLLQRISTAAPYPTKIRGLAEALDQLTERGVTTLADYVVERIVGASAVPAMHHWPLAAFLFETVDRFAGLTGRTPEMSPADYAAFTTLQEPLFQLVARAADSELRRTALYRLQRLMHIASVASIRERLLRLAENPIDPLHSQLVATIQSTSRATNP